MATGREVWVSFGASFIAAVPVPGGAQVTIAADDYEPGSPEEAATLRAVETLQERGCIVRLTRLEPGTGDFNDVHQRDGLDAVKRIIDAAELQAPSIAKAVLPSLYPAPTGSLAAAESQITGVMEQFAQDIREFVQNTDLGKPANPTSRLLITPTGTGKSTLARKAIRQILDDNPGKTIGIASPRHALNDEQAADLRRRLGGKYRVEVYRGRSAEDPEAPLESDAPDAKHLRMCHLHEKIGALVGAGGAPDDLCRKGPKEKPGCPHWDSCGYIKQRRKRADVWLFAHNVRTKKKPTPIGDLAAVFVDESPVDVHPGWCGRPARDFDVRRVAGRYRRSGAAAGRIHKSSQFRPGSRRRSRA